MSVCIGAYIRGIGYTGPWHSCKWRLEDARWNMRVHAFLEAHPVSNQA